MAKTNETVQSYTSNNSVLYHKLKPPTYLGKTCRILDPCAPAVPASPIKSIAQTGTKRSVEFATDEQPVAGKKSTEAYSTTTGNDIQVGSVSFYPQNLPICI